MICNPIPGALSKPIYFPPANIVIAVLKSINIRHFGAKKFPLHSKQETHTITIMTNARSPALLLMPGIRHIKTVISAFVYHYGSKDMLFFLI